MAKVGEGDPRWIVQDRADGTNVNNWHWQEKDCTEWSKKRLHELFTSAQLLDDPVMKATAAGLKSLEGEVLLNNRKKKVIPLYEMNIKLLWKGSVLDGDGNAAGSATGLIHIPYLADENHDEDPEIRISADVDDAASDRLRSALHSKAKPAIVKLVNSFLAELRAGGPQSSGPAADPSDQPSSSAAPGTATPAAAPSTSGATTSAAQTAPKAKKGARDLSSLQLTEKFYARPADLFGVFLDANRIKACTFSDASVEPKVGGQFAWFNGSVTGEFVELEASSKIVMKWRFSNWEDGCFSKVTLTLEEPEPGTTICSLKQLLIPEADRFGNEDVKDMVERGWHEQIFQRIRMVFGYGV